MESVLGSRYEKAGGKGQITTYREKPQKPLQAWYQYRILKVGSIFRVNSFSILVNLTG